MCVCVPLLCILLNNDIIATVRRSLRNIKIKVLWGRKNIIFWVRYCCLVTKSCPIFCDPMGCSLPGSSVYRISQTRILEWVAISFSNAWKWKVKVKSLSHVWLFPTPWTAAYQAPPPMGFSRQEYWSAIAFSVEKAYQVSNSMKHSSDTSEKNRNKSISPQVNNEKRVAT